MNIKSIAVITVMLAVVIGIGFTLSFNKGSGSANVKGIKQIDDGLTVSITDSGFQPQTLKIKADQTVTWHNDSSNQVSINSDPHPTHTKYPPLNLGILSPKEAISLKFPTLGTFGYHNHLDPSQTGTIIVE